MKFHVKLLTYAQNHGLKKVYFEPPAEIQMEYPCIVYRRDTPNIEYSDNIQYLLFARYHINIITTDPEADYPTSFPKDIGMYTSYTGSGTSGGVHNYYFTSYNIY